VPVLDIGNGVFLGVYVQSGRPAGSSGETQLRSAAAGDWEDGLFLRITNYLDIDEARAAAERLAQERADG
jgi:hypothetical protein